MIENNIHELLHIYGDPIYIWADPEDVAIYGNKSEQLQILILTLPGQVNLDNAILMDKMMAACKLRKEDYLLVQSAQEDLFQWINTYQPETVLLFGLSLESEAFSSLKDKNKPFRFAGKKFLLSESLSTIAASPSLKSDLWTNGLKVLFNIT